MEDPAPESESQELPPPGVVCPNCGQNIDPSNLSGPVIECPCCGSQFFPPVPADQDQSDEERDVEETKASQEEELNSLRIRQLGTLRRTAYRTRSYLIIGAAGSAWFTIPLGIAARHHRDGLWPWFYAMMILASLIGAYKFAVRALEVQRGIEADIRARELEELEAAKNPPDLSALSDGSQYAKALEQMFAARKEEASAGDKLGHGNEEMP